MLCAVQGIAAQFTAAQLAVGILAHAATFPLLAGYGNLASVLWPVPLRAALLKRIRGAGPVGARFFAVALLAGAAYAPFALARLMGMPILFAYLGALVVGAFVYGGLLALSAGLLMAK